MTNSELAIRKVEAHVLGSFLVAWPEGHSFDEVMKLVADGDDVIDGPWLAEQMRDARQNLLGLFGEYVDLADALSKTKGAASLIGFKGFVEKAQRLCIDKPWTADQREAIGEVFEHLPDRGIWFEDILTRLENGDKALFDLRVDAALTTGKEVADSLRRAVEDLDVARQEVDLPPYSVLVTKGHHSAVYHALNGFWVPTDQHPEPLLSAGAVDVTRIDIQSFNRFWSHSIELLAEQYPDFKAGKLPLEWVDHFTATNDGKSDFVTAREFIVGEMIEKYIKAKFDVSKFDAVEVAECGVAAVATGSRYPGLVFERWDSADDNDTPLSGSSIWTVYGHLSDGGVEALLDFDLESDAEIAGEAVANIFGIDYGLGPKP